MRTREPYLEPKVGIDVPRPRSGGFQNHRLPRGALQPVAQEQRTVPCPKEKSSNRPLNQPTTRNKRRANSSRTFAFARGLDGDLEQMPRVERLQSAPGERFVEGLVNGRCIVE
jgi:hypothetical protein